MRALSVDLLKNRRRVIVLITSVVVGLNIVVAVLLLSSKVIIEIKEPLTTFSNYKLFGIVINALSFPLLALMGAILGYYFGSKASKGDDEFSDHRPTSTKESIVRSSWTGELMGRLGRPFVASIVFLGHLILAGVLILFIHGLEWLFTRLWTERQPQFFDLVPITWFFDASEIGVLLVFVVFGTLDSFQKLRHR
jgi:hypothetical protein